MAPTKDELEQQNAELRAQLAELEGGPARPAAPARPDYGLSEGERQDLEAHGVTTSPFTGEQLNAVDEARVDVRKLTPEARARAERAARPAESAPDDPPVGD